MSSRATLFLSVGALVAVLAFAAATPAFAQGRVGGTVRDEAGEPIRGATVQAESQDAASKTLTSTTDDKGRFLFIVQRSGEWKFTVAAPGFASTVVSARVRLAASQLGLEIALERREAPETMGILAGIDTKALSTRLASADALLDAGQYDDAIAAYRTLKSQTPALTVIGLQLGNAYLLKKEYDKAEAEFEEVLKSDPANGTACYDLGEAKTARGRLDDAMSWYRKATEADPLWSKPLLKLGVLARDKGDRETAIGYLKKVVALDPNSTEASQAASLLDQLGRVN